MEVLFKTTIVGSDGVLTKSAFTPLTNETHEVRSHAYT